MSQLDMNQLLARLLDQVADLGARRTSSPIRRRPSPSRPTRANSVNTKVTSSQQIGIRLIKEGRVGIAYSESLDASALDAMVQDALDASRFAKVDPDQRITVQQSRLITDCAEIHQADTTAVEEKIALTLRLESDMLALPDVTGAPTTASSRGEPPWLANSQGSVCEHQIQRRLPQLRSHRAGGPPVHALPGTVRTALRRVGEPASHPPDPRRGRWPADG